MVKIIKALDCIFPMRGLVNFIENKTALFGKGRHNSRWRFCPLFTEIEVIPITIKVGREFFGKMKGHRGFTNLTWATDESHFVVTQAIFSNGKFKITRGF